MNLGLPVWTSWYDVTNKYGDGMEWKLHTFLAACGTVDISRGGRMRKDTMLVLWSYGYARTPMNVTFGSQYNEMKEKYWLQTGSSVDSEGFLRTGYVL